MTLLHVALKAEAKPLIEYFKLVCVQKNPIMVYKKDGIILCVSGMGRRNSRKIEQVFLDNKIKTAFNIGIAGCKDKKIKIGELFCTNRNLNYIKYATLTTSKKQIYLADELNTTLVDMEASYFFDIAIKYINRSDIYIFKIVSDYLDITIPKKEFVWKIIEKNLKNISKIVNLKN